MTKIFRRCTISVGLAQARPNKYKKPFKNEQRNRDDNAKKRVNTSGIGESTRKRYSVGLADSAARGIVVR